MDYQPSDRSAEVQQGAGVELARLLLIIKRAVLNWKPSAVLVAVGLIAGVTFAVVRKPSYKSETLVIYRQGVRLTEERAGTSLTLGTRLSEMLLARSRLEPILVELDLYAETRQKQGDIQAVEDFRKDITFKARSTDTFAISYKGKDPETVKKVTERLSASLIEENQRLRVEQSKVQREFLETEKKNAEGLLKEKEQGLATFLSNHPEFALDQNASSFGAAFRAQQKEEERKSLPGGRDAAIDALRRQSERIDATLTGQAGPVMDAPADPEAEAAKQRAQQTLASAKSDLAAKQATLQDKHPDVIAAKGRVADAEKALKSAEDKVSASRLAKAGATGVDLEAAKAKLKDKKRKIDSEIAAREKGVADKKAAGEPASEEVVSIVGLETEWARLSRDVSESRDRMNQLERDYFRAQIEASSSLGGYSDQVVVLDPAYLPTRPEPPGKTLIVLLAGGAAFAIGLVLAFLRALLDSRIFEESDLSRIAPVLAVVPKGGSRRWFRR